MLQNVPGQILLKRFLLKIFHCTQRQSLTLDKDGHRFQDPYKTHRLHVLPLCLQAWRMKRQPHSSGFCLPALGAPIRAPCQVATAHQPLPKCTSVPSLSRKSCCAMNIKKTLSNKYFRFHVHLSQQLYSNDSVCCYLRDKIPKIRQ